MLKVTFVNDRTRGELSLKLQGHAGMAEIGHDIVCAGASILACTVAQEAKNMENRGQLTKPPYIKIQEGNTHIVVHPIDADYDDALHTFYVAQVGYSLLAHNYPQYVELITVNKANTQS